MSTTVSVEYFASLREQRGLPGESVRTSARTARGLYLELQARHGFDLPVETLRVALNHEFQGLDAALNDQDHVVFIQPVAGG